MDIFTHSRLEQLHGLWHKLTLELNDIFDAHGICSVVAYEIAVATQNTTVVGVRDPQNPFFNVWICTPAGKMQQQRWTQSQASFLPLIEKKTAVYTEKFERPAQELINSELWQLPQQGILSVPLPYPAGDSPLTKTPPGILALIDPGTDCYLTQENLPPLATNITTFLDRAFLRHHIDRQDVEFAIVSDINYALASKLSLRNIYYQLMGPVSSALNVETVSIGLVEPGSNDIVFVEMLLGPHFKDMPPIRLEQGQGIAGWVVENGRPLVINNVYTDDRFYAKVDHQSGFKTNSMICVPLQVEERIIGVLQAINKQDGGFTDNDLRLLQAIAGPLAAAIENTNLHSDVIAEKRRIETIFASMSEGLLTINADGYITQANDALMSILTGGQPEDLLGVKASEVIHLKKSSFEYFMGKVLASQGESPQLADDLCPDKQSQVCVPVLISGSPIVKENGLVDEIILVFSDLRQIREVERMRDDFFHGIVHELRTPLATILMYARMLRGGKAQEKEKADRFLGVIERESDRLQKMVRQMLELAKLEARELQRSLEPVPLNPIFAEMLPPLADLATEKGLLFRQRIEADLPPVYGNPETLYLIFKNLVENAIKFTLAGSVRVEARRFNGAVEVTVKDEGIGIPALAMPNLFKRFYRTQNAVERGIAGTGLGLYMVKENVENYNGSIRVKSKEDEGTTITVHFPIAEV
jgi:two-component system, OmpR family, phosphate regulon sensor histidine kinase PhoR